MTSPDFILDTSVLVHYVRDLCLTGSTAFVSIPMNSRPFSYCDRAILTTC